ncbi:LysR family transcriptional regulator [Lapidilactobacillus wuchangensis]|uniref:LysR family transcriptional regulator n=1 Tax=Lapidilactobacillus wuchangensis TaxID=2486001 RepID=UPI000F7A2AD9|nr:LysR family transcriptional regulator [Lapidilactobacillus wuchangensis]
MFKLLTTFKMVYETKSFSHAADLLFIAQPTVSAQIKQLENELQTTLFVRNGRTQLLVTPQAEELYRQASKILDEWTTVKQNLPGSQRLNCRIGASHTFACYFLPELLPQLYQHNQQVNFSVTMLNSLAVFEALQQHKIDLGFIEKPLSSNSIHRQTLFNDQLVLVNGEQPEQPWLVREANSGVYHYTARYFAEHDIQGPQLTIANNQIIVQLLHQNFGKAIISESAAQNLNYQTLGSPYQRQFYLISRQVDKPDQYQSLTKQITAWARQHKTVV